MSEYQYYEFQAIDRSLTQAEKDAIGKLSSRVKPTAVKASFIYSHGDFPGDPQIVLAQYFDIMYYIANWGSQQLMFRFPKSLISQEEIEAYCFEGCIRLSFSKDWAILDWQFHQDEGFDYWVEGEGTLAELIGLRQEILQQDYRGLYLAWLKAIKISEKYGDIDRDRLEPPVPRGLDRLSPAQTAFIETFAVDENLFRVASASSEKSTAILADTWQQAIARLSSSEQEEFLIRLAQGEPNLSIKFKQKLSDSSNKSTISSQPRRTIQQLLESATAEDQQATERRKQEAKAQKIRELEALDKREAQAWQEVETLLEKPQAKTYDQAVKLLVQLRDLADYKNRLSAFQERIDRIYTTYSKRTSFLERLRQANL